MKKHSLLLLGFTTAFSLSVAAQKKDAGTASADKPKDAINNADTYAAFNWREIGPAVTSGRIVDIAVNPTNKSQWYIASAAGGVWKTDNAGTTFNPVFADQPSFSIGCVSIDPQNPNVVWVGTGENNNQRVVAYGDGVYKSEDGGKSWKNMGLKSSEHIGNIAIDPTNSNTVFVAAYGPLWSAGGDRGVYKTTDGGKTWKLVHSVGENTGCNEVRIDPQHPNIVYAAFHQRRRQEWTYVGGGPESAIYRSTDGGEHWDKAMSGMPSGDVGRIGLAISPVNTDVVYAIVEAASGKGVYRSNDRGASWNKQCGNATAGNYYQEIFADPKNVDRVYYADVYFQVSNDGGKTFSGLGERNKHVDNHVIWVDPDNTEHMLVGCDGGLYETFDGAQNWDFKSNLPVTQFYRVAVDNASPFYNVYGGTQDNNTLGGPSRTMSATGITNADWFVTTGGDGFQARVDPNDPNIVYSESQYGGLIRHDRKTGEIMDIRPQEKDGEAAYRWNWDAPLHISNFSNTRLYFCANKVFRSDDRGNSWKVISGDLTRNIDRNKLPVMGKVWSMDAVQKNGSTSIYGNITAFSESSKNENLLYAGTDDGLIQVTTDVGSSWTKISQPTGLPEKILCQYLLASQHDENVVYACMNNERSGDFKPYLLKSSDKGKTWSSISNNLPERGTVYCIAEDYKNASLLFCGTEFGMYFSVDGGKSWMQMTGGLPTTCVHDIAIQKRENDLVIATFGRGFWVLDDYSPLQNMKKEDFDKKANIFPVKDGLAYIESLPYNHKGKSFQGASFFAMQNPPVGATITYWLKDDYKTIKEMRKEREKKLIKDGKPVYYPSPDSIRLEDREEAPYLLLMIADESGTVVRQLSQPAKKGMYRVTWNGRIDKTNPVNFYTPDPDNVYETEDVGPLAVPGKYSCWLVKVQNGVSEKISEAVSFNLNQLNNGSLKVDRTALTAFNKDLAEFRRIMLGTQSYADEMKDRMKFVKAAATQVNGGSDLLKDISDIEGMLKDIDMKFNGDASMSKREFETLPGLNGSIEGIVYGLWSTTQQEPGTYREKLAEVKKKFGPVYDSVKATKAKLESVEGKLNNLKAPYTPGRLPEYSGH